MNKLWIETKLFIILFKLAQLVKFVVALDNLGKTPLIPCQKYTIEKKTEQKLVP